MVIIQSAEAVYLAFYLFLRDLSFLPNIFSGCQSHDFGGCFCLQNGQ